MILIQTGVEKEVYLTLTPTSITSFFLFEFTSKITGESKYMTTLNVSNADTYQKFLFKHNTANPNSGGFILGAGDYNYTVYETVTATLDVSQAINKLSVGLMRIVESGDLTYNLEDMGITYYNG